MSTTFADIDEIFNIAVLNAGFSIDVITENLDYSPNISTPYIAAFLLPLPTVQASLGSNGCDNQSGIYQLDINYPKDQGTTALKEMADEINGVFFSGANFSNSNLTVNIKNVSINRVIVQNGWASLSVSIEFYAYSMRV